jgi:hypothetical protein
MNAKKGGKSLSQNSDPFDENNGFTAGVESQSGKSCSSSAV